MIIEQIKKLREDMATSQKNAQGAADAAAAARARTKELATARDAADSKFGEKSDESKTSNGSKDLPTRPSESDR